VKYVPAHYQSEEAIMCIAPGGWSVGAEAVVEVTMNGNDYTNFNHTFNFFQIDGVTPQSGPAHGSETPITVTGSGFRNARNAALFVNHQPAKLVSFGDDFVSFEMPEAKYGEGYTGSVDLDASINGVDFHSFPGGFKYYTTPTVAGVSPDYGPIGGSTPIKMEMLGMDQESMDQFESTCKVGTYVGDLAYYNEDTALCYIPQSVSGTDAEFSLPVSVSYNGFDYTTTGFTYSTYGAVSASPQSGPTTGGTEILVKGYGFAVGAAGVRGFCRFGDEKDFVIVEGNVLDRGNMICVSPGEFGGRTSAMAADRALEIGFAADNADVIPWTGTGIQFRFYKHPKIAAITPKGCDISEQVEVLITSKGKTDFSEIWIDGSGVCRFGEYGTAPAVVAGDDTITCVSPAIDIDPETISRIQVSLELSINGQEFYTIGKFTFAGSAEGYWILMIWLACIICVVMIAALLSICCYYCFHTKRVYNVYQVE
jgi:hypothetical protein